MSSSASSRRPAADAWSRRRAWPRSAPNRPALARPAGPTIVRRLRPAVEVAKLRRPRESVKPRLDSHARRPSHAGARRSVSGTWPASRAGRADRGRPSTLAARRSAAAAQRAEGRGGPRCDAGGVGRRSCRSATSPRSADAGSPIRPRGRLSSWPPPLSAAGVVLGRSAEPACDRGSWPAGGPRATDRTTCNAASYCPFVHRSLPPRPSSSRRHRLSRSRGRPRNRGPSLSTDEPDTRPAARHAGVGLRGCVGIERCSPAVIPGEPSSHRQARSRRCHGRRPDRSRPERGTDRN